MTDAPRVAPVSARDPATRALVDELTAELAAEGYAVDETFGYSLEQIEERGVVLLGAWVGDELSGIGGLEVGEGGEGELKRFFVRPAHRGGGAADAILRALIDVARGRGVVRVRLETGDRQLAAVAFYRRHGFGEIPRFGPYVDSATSVCMGRRLS